RLPDGSICTVFTEPGAPERGHWIYDRPFSDDVREALVAGARQTEHRVRAVGCYGHVDGPRFNTETEIRQLQAAGVTAVSQTGGPETVLFGELQVPYALMGFATDYANGISPNGPTPVEELIELMGQSTSAFGDVLSEALPGLAGSSPRAPGVVYRFEQ
ncbi:MAG TPA: phosphorylase, partial [Solirubrobacteraceae bacterium]